MPEPFSPEQLRQLRQRWERDPKSRAFLQLAEEYRRAGSLAEAIHVLRAGLMEHPNYLSAQVALGRSLVEANQPGEAIALLERAVARDPTQLVANKLLVEAYLSRGEAAKARERLELYKLFNDRDEEIEPLEGRIRALEAPAAAALAARSRAAQETPAEALFELPAPVPLPEVNLDSMSLPSRATSPDRDAEPFGHLFGASAVRSIEAALAEQGIFPLAPAAERTWWEARDESASPPAFVSESAPELAAVAAAPEVADGVAEEAAAPRDWEAASWPDGGAAALAEAPEERLPETVPAAQTAPWFAAEPVPAMRDNSLPVDLEEPELVAAPPADEWAESVAVPETATASAGAPVPVLHAPDEAAGQAKAASTTLGELYLAQGHLAEAEESFRSVLKVRPGDAAALAGLESVRLQRGDDRFAFADEAGVTEEPNAVFGGLAARKAELLKAYLARFRRGAQRHVS